MVEDTFGATTLPDAPVLIVAYNDVFLIILDSEKEPRQENAFESLKCQYQLSACFCLADAGHLPL